MGKILALDVGNRRIGLAVSDELGLSATGLETLHRTTRKHDLEVLGKIAKKHQVEEIVIGLPLNMNGTESEQTEKTRTFADMVREKLKLPVVFWDERLTSWEAQELLKEKSGGKQDKSEIDKLSACLILQGYLASKARS
jgi:putative Holliday junction resolvase